MPRVFVAVGSNLGDRAAHLEKAVRLLGMISGLRLVQTSRIYETDPVGGPAMQGKYFNAVWELDCELPPDRLLESLMALEKTMGRTRREVNGPRIIDLDILFYEDKVVDRPGLTVPHPRLHERDFVLRPLCDVAPEFRHPVLGKTALELLTALDRGGIKEKKI